MKAIYLNGERFGSMERALRRLESRWGKRLDYRQLRELADREGMIAAEGRELIRVSWKGAEREAPKEAEREGEAEGAVRRRAALLRYPHGETARYEWSRRWR